MLLCVGSATRYDQIRIREKRVFAFRFVRDGSSFRAGTVRNAKRRVCTAVLLHLSTFGWGSKWSVALPPATNGKENEAAQSIKSTNNRSTVTQTGI